MMDKIVLAEKPDKKLVLSFIVGATPTIADDLLVEFAQREMWIRLNEQREKGFHGWNTTQCKNADLKARLIKNVSTGDWVDVMNLAAMLLAREQLFIEKQI